MNLGMLWFDNDPKASLDVKVERAAAYYQHKYGKTPTLCFVHPSMLSTGREALPNERAEEAASQKESYMAGNIEVRKNRSVLPNHFWLGVNGSAEAAVTA
jgi:hypothetical protein